LNSGFFRVGRNQQVQTATRFTECQFEDSVFGVKDLRNARLCHSFEKQSDHSRPGRGRDLHSDDVQRLRAKSPDYQPELRRRADTGHVCYRPRYRSPGVGAGFQNRSAQDGTFVVELNPANQVGLYQEVCLINNETLSWNFYHAARTAANAPTNQTVEYSVVSLDGATTHQLLDTNTVTEAGPNGNQSLNDWELVNGTTTYTGPTGIQRLEFRSTNAGDAGNFLDDIQLAVVPSVTFLQLATSAPESDPTVLPLFAISGIVPTTFDIQFAITGGTATVGADFTVASNTITVAAGTYDGVSAGSLFPLPITILTDSIVEGSETIEITYTTVTPITAAALTGPNCTAPQTVAIHTILDSPPIDAVDDDFTSTPIPTTGGTTPSVFGDDSFSGSTPGAGDVTAALTDLGGLTGATILRDL